MMPILTPMQYGWLGALLLLWALLLFGGYFAGNSQNRAAARMPRWTRLASSVVLVVAAWSWVVVARQTPASGFAFLVAAGMSLGFLGDLFMAGVMPGGSNVLGGMAAFGLGHIAYIAGGLRLGAQLGLTASPVRLVGWLTWLVVGFFGWFLIVFRHQRPTTLHWVALAYSLLLASTAGVATGIALLSPRFAPLAVGAALFLLSDLLIAARLFAAKTSRKGAIDDLIWLTYGPGQMLIVYSIAAALT